MRDLADDFFVPEQIESEDVGGVEPFIPEQNDDMSFGNNLEDNKDMGSDGEVSIEDFENFFKPDNVVDSTNNTTSRDAVRDQVKLLIQKQSQQKESKEIDLSSSDLLEAEMGNKISIPKDEQKLINMESVEPEIVNNYGEEILDIASISMDDLLTGTSHVDNDDVENKKSDIEVAHKSSEKHNNNSGGIKEKLTSISKSFLETEGSSDVERKTKLVKSLGIIVLVCFTVICIVVSLVSALFGSEKKSDKKVEYSAQQNLDNVYNQSKSTVDTKTLLKNESFTGLSDYVGDILIVEKYGKIVGNNVNLYFGGDTTKNKVRMEIPVSAELYNSVVNGSLLKVEFKVIQIGSDKYCTEARILEVIE